MTDTSSKRGGPAEHVARAGDHISRVASVYGFRSYEPLWSHPNNAALRQKRQSPHIIAVGDTVHVPAMAVKDVQRGTEQRHRFRLQLHPLVVRLVFQKWDGRPIETRPSEVRVDSKATDVRGSGATVEVDVSPISDWCVVKWSASEISTRVGLLQPKDVVAGYRQRLNNLGYNAGDSDDPSDYQFRSAIEEFQCDEGLVVDGKCGPATQARLAKVHGS